MTTKLATVPFVLLSACIHCFSEVFSNLEEGELLCINLGFNTGSWISAAVRIVKLDGKGN